MKAGPTQSHEIAKRVRPAVDEIGRRFGARVKVAEVPPGPPVLETLVAEIYGENRAEREALARQVREIFERTEGVVDVDWYVEDDQPKYRFEVDREKAALGGVGVDDVAATLRVALGGERAGLLSAPGEKEEVPIVVRLVLREQRVDLARVVLQLVQHAGVIGAVHRLDVALDHLDRVRLDLVDEHAGWHATFELGVDRRDRPLERRVHRPGEELVALVELGEVEI